MNRKRILPLTFRNRFIVTLFLACLSLASVLASEEEWLSKHSSKETADPVLSNDPSLTDSYLEGYIQALLDETYPHCKTKVIVRDRLAYLYKMPRDEGEADKMAAFVRDVPGIRGVRREFQENTEPASEEKYIGTKPQIKGIWFPQNTVLFPPLIASPRAVTNSIMYRWQWGRASHYEGKTAVAVSFGDIFPLYRWIDIGSIHAKIQLSLEAGAWSVFRIDHNEQNDWSEFIDVDFLLGIPVTMAVGNWSFELRGYHTSTHLGDEFIVNNPGFQRLNPSYEGIDLYVAWQLKEHFRPYIGGGRIFRSDNTFPFQPLYFVYGLEVTCLRRVVHYNRLYGQIFAAVNFENDETRHWALDTTCAAGYEWSKLRGAGRKFRLYMEYHNGFSPDGQFYKMRLSYYGLCISFGF